jgi:hypothetical protein
MAEKVQARDANIQLFRDTTASLRAKAKDAEDKLAIAEKELQELRTKTNQADLSKEKLSGQFQLVSSLRLELEKKDGEIASSKSEQDRMESVHKEIEHTFRRIGLLHPREVFNQQAITTVGERISILQLHEAERIAAKTHVPTGAPETVLEVAIEQGVKKLRKANRSSIRTGNSGLSLTQQNEYDHARKINGEDQLHTQVVGLRFQETVSTTTRTGHVTSLQPNESRAGGTTAGRHDSPDFEPLEFQPYQSMSRQRPYLMASSPLSNIPSSDVETPSGFRSGKRNGHVARRGKETASLGSPVSHETFNSTSPNKALHRSSNGVVAKRPSQASLEKGQGSTNHLPPNISEGNGKTAPMTSQKDLPRSIMKSIASPSQRKRASADEGGMQTRQKRVKLDAPSTHSSQASNEHITSSHFPIRTSSNFFTSEKSGNQLKGRKGANSGRKGQPAADTSRQGPITRRRSSQGKVGKVFIPVTADSKLQNINMARGLGVRANSSRESTSPFHSVLSVCGLHSYSVFLILFSFQIQSLMCRM